MKAKFIYEAFEEKSKEKARDEMLFPELKDLSYFDMDIDGGWTNETGEEVWKKASDWDDNEMIENQIIAIIHQENGMPSDYFIKNKKTGKFYNISGNYEVQNFESHIYLKWEDLLKNDIIIFSEYDLHYLVVHYLVVYPHTGNIQHWIEKPTIEELEKMKNA